MGAIPVGAFVVIPPFFIDDSHSGEEFHADDFILRIIYIDIETWV